MPVFMSLPEFEQALEYLDRSGIDDARLLGGEPTLHPEFSEFVQIASRRGKRIVVFTHAVMPDSALQSLMAIPEEKCSLIVNMSAVFRELPDVDAQAEKRQRTLVQLGQRAMPGFTIQTADFDLSQVTQVAKETGMRKIIRLGLALPGAGTSNQFVHPKQYRLIGSRIAQQAELAASQGFILSFDCGFVRCMFSEDELLHLRDYGAEMAWHCSPILDICPNNKVFHCFSLSDRFVQPFTAQVNAANLHSVFEQQISAYRMAGIFRECANCTYKTSHECSGGCLSAVLKRFRPASFRVDFFNNQPIIKEKAFE